jgi:oligopeptide/dipeptide ABC transporter ATP-binding protein
MSALLEIDRLSIEFNSGGNRNRAINDVSLTVAPGEIVAVVGESGCGKSVTALSALRLLPETATITSGEIRVDGDDLLAMSKRELRRVRGGTAAMIFQDPSTSLNPVFTVGQQLRRALAEHAQLDRKAAASLIEERLTAVGLPDASRVLASYPHQLSGGMKQRVMIAMALVGEPRLLIADEPTTALDVTVQSQILSVLLDVRERFEIGVLLISHDLGVVSQVADRVAVMYAGTVIESGPVDHFAHPQHPYTAGLIAAIPTAATPRSGLESIPGTVPSDPGGIEGCVYASRCPHRMDVCAEPPPIRRLADGAHVACHLERLP